MKKRLPLALALALATAACTPPAGGTGAAGSYDKKVAKVEQLTKALSLSQNEELKKAAGSVTQLGSSMSQGGFAKATSAAGGLVAAGGGNIVAAGGGNLVAAGGGNVMVNNGANYVLQALVEDLNAGLRQDVYGLMGTMDGGNGSTVSYDDETGELTGVSDGKTEAKFAFVNNGKERTWTIDILKSPDGTTGTMKIAIEADVWKAAPAQQAAQPDDAAWWGDEQPADQPDFGGEDPLPGDLDGGMTDPDAGVEDEEPTEDDFGVDVGEDEQDEDDQAAEDDFGLQQAAPQIKIFNNEAPDPNTLTALRFTCDLVPQGDPALRVKIDAAIDGVEVTKLGRIPTHLKLNLTVPTVQFTSDTTFDGATKLTSAGGLKVRTAEALESLKYDVDVRTEGSGKLGLVHEGAKVRMAVEVPKPTGGKPATPVAALYDTETDQKLADLEASKSEPGITLIKFTNGKTVRWDMASGTTMAMPGAGPTTRPKAAPSPRRSTAPRG